MSNQHEVADRPRATNRPAVLVLAVVALVLGWAQLILLEEQFWIGLSGILVAVALAALLRAPGVGVAGRIGVVVAAGVVVAQVTWLATSWWPLQAVALIALIALGFVALAAVWTLRNPASHTTGVGRVRRLLVVGVGSVATALAVVISAVLVVTAISPVPAGMALQAAVGHGNSFEPAAPTATTVVNGVALTNDIEYASEYPNSFLDVYIADNDATVSRPTYVNVHGGGFIAGDKTDGDPNAAGSGDGAYFALGTLPMMEAGYNVVTINYALAPQYRYPTPVVQLGQAMQFLEANGAQYGLDMTRVVLAGGSAGGHIVGQYASIQTNPEYAASVGLEPTMNPDVLKAMVFDSAGLDVSRLSAPQAPDAVSGWLYDFSGRSYAENYYSDEIRRETNIIDSTSPDYPPSFVSDGNDATFPDQAAELAARLQNMGVPAQLNLYTRTQAILGHGFTSQASPWTDDYNRLKIDFLNQHVPGMQG